MGHSHSPVRAGMTRIEVAVVLVVISMAIAILIPLVQSARESARRKMCQSNLKAIGLSLREYSSVFERFPSGWIGVNDKHKQPDVFGMNGMGWGCYLLTAIDHTPLFSQIDFRHHLADPLNDAFREGKRWHAPEAFYCPSEPQLKPWSTEWNGRSVVMPSSSYVGVFGSQGLSNCGSRPESLCRGDGAFYQNSSVRWKDITNGTSNTFAIGERRTQHLDPGKWYSTWAGIIPGDQYGPERLLGAGDHVPGTTSGGLADFSSHHDHGAQFLAFDGSVRFVSRNIELSVYRSLLTIDSKSISNRDD